MLKRYASLALLLFASGLCLPSYASVLHRRAARCVDVSYHNPDNGRFWTMDSFEGFGSDPSSLHKYTYCNGNPINRFDPSGHNSYAETSVASGISLKTRLTYGTMWGLLGGSIEGIRSHLDGGSYFAGFARGFGAGFVFGAMLGPLPASAWLAPSGQTLIILLQSAGLSMAVQELQQGKPGLAVFDALLNLAPSMLTVAQQTEVMNYRLGGFRLPWELPAGYYTKESAYNGVLRLSVCPKDSIYATDAFIEAYSLSEGTLHMKMLNVPDALKAQGIGRALMYQMIQRFPNVTRVKAELWEDNLATFRATGDVLKTHYGKVMDELGFDTRVTSDGYVPTVESTRR